VGNSKEGLWQEEEEVQDEVQEEHAADLGEETEAEKELVTEIAQDNPERRNE